MHCLRTTSPDDYLHDLAKVEEIHSYISQTKALSFGGPISANSHCQPKLLLILYDLEPLPSTFDPKT